MGDLFGTFFAFDGTVDTTSVEDATLIFTSLAAFALSSSPAREEIFFLC
jgi:hypothetical protein